MKPIKITFGKLGEAPVSTAFRKIKTFQLPDSKTIDRIRQYDYFYHKQWFEVEVTPKPISKILAK